MSEATFTPGPWGMRPFGDNNNGQWITASQPPTLKYVAGIYQSFDDPVANARLIAAAPDMYAALRAITETYEKQRECRNCSGRGTIEGSGAIAAHFCYCQAAIHLAIAAALPVLMKAGGQ